VNLPRGKAATLDVERELARIERRLRGELTRELDARMLELKRQVADELGQVNGRIDGVLARSLRALNPPTERR
jgi:hypothetical protein